MDTWEEKYLKLAAELDRVVTKTKPKKPPEQNDLLQQTNVALRKRLGELSQEFITLYKDSYALKIEGFFKTLYNWAKSGFKMTKKDLAESRLAICNACPHFKSDRCVLCGCYMKNKVKIAKASCPVKKWLPQEDQASS